MKSIDGIITAKPKVLKRYEDVQFEKKMNRYIAPLEMKAHEHDVKLELHDFHFDRLGADVDRFQYSQQATNQKQSKLTTIAIQGLIALLVGFMIVAVGIL